MELKFRPLNANEVECRVGMAKQEGCSLLLYKDARVDMALLDEVAGPMNWQRKHTRENANCIVSVYDDDKKQWIDKEDTGTESNTEKEKGKASDSFKRACVNWGIGRELYTAPFIWIGLSKGETYESGKDRYGKPAYRLSKKIKFSVTQMSVANGRITALTVIDQTGKQRYQHGGSYKPQAPSIQSMNKKIDPVKLQALEELMIEVDADVNGFNKFFKIDNTANLTVGRYKEAVKMLEKKRK